MNKKKIPFAGIIMLCMLFLCALQGKAQGDPTNIDLGSDTIVVCDGSGDSALVPINNMQDLIHARQQAEAANGSIQDLHVYWSILRQGYYNVLWEGSINALDGMSDFYLHFPLVEETTGPIVVRLEMIGHRAMTAGADPVTIFHALGERPVKFQRPQLTGVPPVACDMQVLRLIATPCSQANGPFTYSFVYDDNNGFHHQGDPLEGSSMWMNVSAIDFSIPVFPDNLGDQFIKIKAMVKNSRNEIQQTSTYTIRKPAVGKPALPRVTYKCSGNITLNAAVNISDQAGLRFLWYKMNQDSTLNQVDSLSNALLVTTEGSYLVYAYKDDVSGLTCGKMSMPVKVLTIGDDMVNVLNDDNFLIPGDSVRIWLDIDSNLILFIQWYKYDEVNGVFTMINGANNLDYWVKSTGRYAASLNNGSCVTPMYANRAVQINGTQAFTATDDNTVGKKEIDVTLYPTPIKTLGYVEFHDKEILGKECLFELYDMGGKLITSWHDPAAEKMEHDYSSLSRGVYIVKIAIPDVHVNKQFKIIKTGN